jgi:PBP1b-binding outer membrane lipoprotein LpoB
MLVLKIAAGVVLGLAIVIVGCSALVAESVEDEPKERTKAEEAVSQSQEDTDGDGTLDQQVEHHHFPVIRA